MPTYNPEDERIKNAYLRHLKQAGGKSKMMIDGVRKAVGRLRRPTLGSRTSVSYGISRARARDWAAHSETMRECAPTFVTAPARNA